MRIYEYDIWNGDKGIIFANNMKEAKAVFKGRYFDTKIPTGTINSGECIINLICNHVPSKPELVFMHD